MVGIQTRKVLFADSKWHLDSYSCFDILVKISGYFGDMYTQNCDFEISSCPRWCSQCYSADLIFLETAKNILLIWCVNKRTWIQAFFKMMLGKVWTFYTVPKYLFFKLKYPPYTVIFYSRDIHRFQVYMQLEVQCSEHHIGQIRFNGQNFVFLTR